MIPIAVIAGRHWKAIGGGFAGLGGMLLLSLPFGLFLWPDWARMIARHPAIVSGYGLDVLGASPMMALKVLGWPKILDGLFVLLAIVLTWRAFRDNDLKLRVLILLEATLIASPYSIRYELAMLSPSLVDALWAGTARGLLIALPLYGLNVLTIVPALVASAIAAILPRRRSRRSGYRRASRRLRPRSAPSGISRGRRSTRCRESRPCRRPANGEFAAGS